MFKRIIVITLLICLLISISACRRPGSDGSNSKGGKQLIVWHELEPDKEKFVNEFIKSQGLEKDIKFEHKTSFGDVVSNAITGDNLPDMVLVGGNDYLKLEDAGKLQPIDQVMESDVVAKLADGSKEFYTKQGKLYAAPFYSEVCTIIYNKNLLSESQLPKTAEDLLKLQKELTKDGNYGILSPNYDAFFAAPFIYGFKANLINKTGTKAAFDTPEMKKALAYYKELFESSPKVADKGQRYQTCAKLFEDQKAAMLINGPWYVSDLLDESGNPKFDFGFIKFPTVDGIAMPPYGQTKGISVTTKCSNMDKAGKFLNLIAGDEKFQQEFALKFRYTPVIKAVLNSPELTKDPIAVGFANQIKQSISMPSLPSYSLAAGQYSLLLETLINTKEPLENVVERFQKLADEQIKAAAE